MEITSPFREANLLVKINGSLIGRSPLIGVYGLRFSKLRPLDCGTGNTSRIGLLRVSKH